MGQITKLWAKTWFKITVGVVGLILLGIGSLLGLASNHMSQARNQLYDVPPIEWSEEVHADVELGKRIVTIRNGCVDCHGSNLEGNTVVDDAPFAIIRAGGLTADRIGDWSDGEIARAVRHGIGKDNKALVLMPSHEYHALSESDLASVVAYLRSLPEGNSKEAEVALGPISKMLYFFGKLPTLLPAGMIDHEAGFEDKPFEAPTRDFGRYLVESSCVGCHGPGLEGGPIPGGPPDWPAASNISHSVVSKWNQDAFFKAMKEGVSPSTGQALRRPMPVGLTKQMNETELTAIWKYLSSKKPAVARDEK